MKLKTLPWILFALLAIGVGLYPVAYYVINMRHAGLLQSKSKALLDSAYYIPIFYIHITCGGIALLTGWSQFSARLRRTRLRLHRILGKVYVCAVILSSLAGFTVAMSASGGIACQLGFGILAAIWFATILKAYTSILKKDLVQHRAWMIRNYALTFAAVTLRIYLPFSQLVLHADFITAYRIISWLCWVPNLLIAQIIINRAMQPPVVLVGAFRK